MDRMLLYVIRRKDQEMWLKRLQPLLWSPRENAMPFRTQGEAQRVAARFPGCIVEKVESGDPAP
jgi:hypothetical protein